MSALTPASPTTSITEESSKQNHEFNSPNQRRITSLANETLTNIPRLEEGHEKELSACQMYDTIVHLNPELQTNGPLQMKLMEKLREELSESFSVSFCTNAQGQAGYQIGQAIKKNSNFFVTLKELCEMNISLVDYESTGFRHSFHVLHYCKNPDIVELLLKFSSQDTKNKVLKRWSDPMLGQQEPYTKLVQTALKCGAIQQK